MLKRGLTLIELLIVMGIIAILMTVVTVSTLQPQRQADSTETVAVLTSDLRTAQLQAMLGDATLGSPSPRGIYFEPFRYVLFSGSVYNSSDPANFAVDLPPGFTFSEIGFPSSLIIFSRGSGEISNFTLDSYNLVLLDTQDGKTSTITINRYGTVLQVI